MHPGICVGNTEARIGMHPGGAGVMMCIGIGPAAFDLHSTNAGCLHPPTQRLPKSFQFGLFFIAPAPMHRNTRHPKRVPVSREHDSILRVRPLLDVDKHTESVEALTAGWKS